jgi:hypothetical protein
MIALAPCVWVGVNYVSQPYWLAKKWVRYRTYTDVDQLPGLLLNQVFKTYFQDVPGVVELGFYVVFSRRLVQLSEHQRSVAEAYNQLERVWHKKETVEGVFAPSFSKVIYRARSLRGRVGQLAAASTQLAWQVTLLGLTMMGLLEVLFAAKEKRRELIFEHLGQDVLELCYQLKDLQAQRTVLHSNMRTVLDSFKGILPTQTGEIEQLQTFLEKLLATSEKVDHFIAHFFAKEEVWSEEEEYLPVDALPPLAEYTLEESE